jgi:hypothetical protein
MMNSQTSDGWKENVVKRYLQVHANRHSFSNRSSPLRVRSHFCNAVRPTMPMKNWIAGT